MFSKTPIQKYKVKKTLFLIKCSFKRVYDKTTNVNLKNNNKKTKKL